MNTLRCLWFTVFMLVAGPAFAQQFIPGPVTSSERDAALMVTALLRRYPNTPARACIEAHQIEIVDHLVAAERLGVPPGLALAVAFHETHVGCDTNEGGGWGAPIDMRHRHTAGTPEHAVRALRRSFDVCHRGWVEAVSRFRSGLCYLPRDDRRRGYVRSVLQLAGVIYRAVDGSNPRGFAFQWVFDHEWLASYRVERRFGGE